MRGGIKRKAVLLRGCVLLAAALVALGVLIISMSTIVPFYTVFADDTPGPSALWAWGWNSYGQLGDGTTDSKNNPTLIGSETGWSAIALGASHNEALFHR